LIAWVLSCLLARRFVDPTRPWVCLDGLLNGMDKVSTGPMLDYGAGSRGLSGVWRLGGAWPLDWVREGGTGKAPRTLVLKLSPLLRDLTKLSPWPRLLHTDQITRVIDTGITISIIPKSHRCTKLSKQLHAFAARHLTIATMQAIPMAQTLPSSMMGKMRAFLCNRIIASRYSES
jgi:hypothetical protein